MLEKNKMGRVSVEFFVANNCDVVDLGDGDNVLDKVKQLWGFRAVSIAGRRNSHCRNASWISLR